jgi:hypothetical protein
MLGLFSDICDLAQGVCAGFDIVVVGLFCAYLGLFSHICDLAQGVCAGFDALVEGKDVLKSYSLE